MAVLTVSTSFMSKHPRKGQPTNFESLILKGSKIHTIRANVKHWTKIVTNCALLDIRKWADKPYKSDMLQIKRIEPSNGLGIEFITLDLESGTATITDGKKTVVKPLATIAENDGLSLDDFKAWFAGYDTTEQMAIIHFTDFRYCV